MAIRFAEPVVNVANKRRRIANSSTPIPWVVTPEDLEAGLADIHANCDKKGRYRDPEKRRAYMREYMAKRRAKVTDATQEA